MKYVLIMLIAFSAVSIKTQTVVRVPEPQYIAVDSKDNVYIAIKYGIIRVTPDGTLTNLTKVAGTIGDMDKNWKNLIVDSKDNFYASDDRLIYKFAFDRAANSWESYLPGSNGPISSRTAPSRPPVLIRSTK